MLLMVAVAIRVKMYTVSAYSICNLSSLEFIFRATLVTLHLSVQRQAQPYQILF